MIIVGNSKRASNKNMIDLLLIDTIYSIRITTYSTKVWQRMTKYNVNALGIKTNIKSTFAVRFIL